MHEDFEVWEARDVGSDWGPYSSADRAYYLFRIETGVCPVTEVKVA